MVMKKTFIIAEAGVNHNGDINLAYKLIDAAKEAGADAVKFQTFKSEKVISKKAEMAEYQKKNTGKEESQIEMIKRLELTYNDFSDLKKYCDKKGIMFLSTAFDNESIDFIDNLVPIFKVPSGEINNFPYLEKIAQKNKPVIMSTGMANLSDIEKALKTIKNVNEDLDITVLHCTTNYPCPYDEVNLKAMNTIKNAFKVKVGYSDHTLGVEIPVAAVAMGAEIIEKHFTLDKTLPGPDHKASLEPRELKDMVEKIRNIEKALGDGIKKPNLSEEKIKSAARKSLVANMDLEKGTILKKENFEIKRPGNGISPEFLDILVGKKLVKDIKEDEIFTWEHFME
jgi:N-acetylneuraminate synthase